MPAPETHPDDPAALERLLREAWDRLDRSEILVQKHETRVQELERALGAKPSLEKLGELPDDPATLKQMVGELLTQIGSLEHRLRLLLRRSYGPSSEKIDPHQLQLFDEKARAEAEQADAETEAKSDHRGRRRSSRLRNRGRRPLPPHLIRERIEHEPPPEERACGRCGNTMTRIGEETSEQLEYRPASFVVLQHARGKWACTDCEDGVVTADKPPQPIEKGLPAAGMLAHVIVSKYADHLPLHRQSQIYQRAGLDLPRSTLCDWVAASAKELEPLWKAMCAEVLASRKINTDDTPIRVLDANGESRTRLGRLWVYCGDSEHPHIVFDYTPTRRREGPVEFLAGYEGYLQADAYKGYDGIFASGKVIEVACWAHVRRRFFEARQTDRARAETAMAFIRQLYAVEKEARERGLAPEELQALRLERSKPVLARIRAWLESEAQARDVLPKSPIGTAISYAQEQWVALERYLENGILDIDNNAAENGLRAVAIGRKNYLFLGSDEGGRRAAVAYTLVQSCKKHRVDPLAYLRDVLARMPTHPARAISELTPVAWKKAREPAGGG